MAPSGSDLEAVPNSTPHTEDDSWEEEMLQDGAQRCMDKFKAKMKTTRLSQAERALVSSEGPEVEEAFYAACLCYANDDIKKAAAVASRFLKLRVHNNWPMRIRGGIDDGPAAAASLCPLAEGKAALSPRAAAGDAAAAAAAAAAGGGGGMSPSKMRSLLLSGVHHVLPHRDSLGRRVLLFNPARIDTTKGQKPEDYHQMLSFILERLIDEQYTRRAGVALVVDCRDVGVGLVRTFGLSDYRRAVGLLSSSFPIKCKQILLYESHRAVKIALRIVLPLLGRKMRERIQSVSGKLWEEEDGNGGQEEEGDEEKEGEEEEEDEGGLSDRSDVSDVSSVVSSVVSEAEAEQVSNRLLSLDRDRVPVELGGEWEGLQESWRRWVDDHCL